MATPITALNIKLRMDTRAVAAGSDQVRKDVARVNSIVRKARTDTQKYEEAAASLTRRLEAGALTTKRYRQLLAEVHQQYITGPQRIAAEKAAIEAANEAKRKAAIIERQRADAAKRAAEEMQRSAAEQRRLAAYRSTDISMLRQSSAATERYQKTLRQLAKSQAQGAITQQQYSAAVRRAAQDYTRAATASQRMQAANANVQSSTGSLIASAGKLGLAYLTVQKAMQGVSFIANERMSLETTQAAFKVYTGSVERGNMLLREMRQLAASTPLAFEQVTQAAQTLLGFGVAADDVNKRLRQLGDIAAGDNERFQRLALAYSQISASGKLMGQDLNQLIQAGFNPLQEITRTTGKSYNDLRKQMEDGRVTIQMVHQAMESLTSGTGRAKGAMDEFAKTSAGGFEILKSELKTFAADFGWFIDTIGGQSKQGFMARASQDLAAVVKSVREWMLSRTTIAAEVERAEQAFKKATVAAKEFRNVTFARDDSKEIAAAKVLADLQAQRLAARNGELYGEAAAFKQSGATDSQVEQFKFLKQQIAKIEEAKQAREEETREIERQKQIFDRMAERGRQLQGEVSPARAVGEQLGELNALLRVGAIDRVTFMKQQNKILADAAKEGLQAVQPDALEFGSKEAADMVQRQMFDTANQQLVKMEQQRLLQEAANTLLDSMNRHLAELQPTRRIR